MMEQKFLTSGTLTRATLLAALGTLLGYGIWAGLRSPLWEGLAAVAAEPWGLVTFLDLTAGLIGFGAVILLAERGRPAGWAWFAAALILGNGVTLAWLLLGGLAKLEAALGRRAG